jgi:uncharacterized protein YwqG
MLTALNKHIDELELNDYAQFLTSIARPSIELIWSDAPIAAGTSKFGGSPDVPPDFQWPQHRLGPYRFIGQVNLSLIPKYPTDLPDKGLLSFFYAHDDEGEMFWGDPGFVLAFYFESAQAVRPIVAPEAVRFGPTSAIDFEVSADVPEWPWSDADVANWPIDESRRDDYWELRCQLRSGFGHLLGYPFNTTLAYDPTPGPGWCSLLNLGSNPYMQWCWHDGDRLVTFIENRRLREADFSEIKADAG